MRLLESDFFEYFFNIYIYNIFRYTIFYKYLLIYKTKIVLSSLNYY